MSGALLFRNALQRVVGPGLPPAAERARLQRSLAAHGRFQAMYASGAVKYLWLLLRRGGGRPRSS